MSACGSEVLIDLGRLAGMRNGEDLDVAGGSAEGCSHRTAAEWGHLFLSFLSWT